MLDEGLGEGGASPAELPQARHARDEVGEQAPGGELLRRGAVSVRRRGVDKDVDVVWDGDMQHADGAQEVLLGYPEKPLARAFGSHIDPHVMMLLIARLAVQRRACERSIGEARVVNVVQLREDGTDGILGEGEQSQLGRAHGDGVMGW